MDTCPQCGLTFSDSTDPRPSSCPNCGKRIAPESTFAGGGLDLIRGYFRTLWQILTRPSQFFRNMSVSGGVSSPLAFALITHWMGSAVSFLWNLVIGGSVAGVLGKFFQVAGDVADVDHPGRHAQFMEMSEKLSHWLWGAGSIIADPFFTLARILFITFLVFIGARILVTPGRNGAPREITFESALRIICYGLTPSILAALPLFGGFISNIYIVVVTVIGAREVYRIGSGRAVIVAMFPQFILLAVFGTIFFALMLAMFKLMASIF